MQQMPRLSLQTDSCSDNKIRLPEGNLYGLMLARLLQFSTPEIEEALAKRGIAHVPGGEEKSMLCTKLLQWKNEVQKKELQQNMHEHLRAVQHVQEETEQVIAMPPLSSQ